MRIYLLLAAAPLAACTGEAPGVELRGTLAEGWPAGQLTVSAGGVESGEVRDGAFRLAGLPAGPTVLRIASELGELAAIELDGIPAGAEVTLERIRRDPERDLAFPGAVALRGADAILVHGVRYGNADDASGAEAIGTVLARDGAGEHLLVRVADGVGPDLRVVVGPATDVRHASGDTARADRLNRGDTVRVAGASRAGYLHAARVTVPDAPPPAAAPAPAARRSAPAPAPAARQPSPPRSRDAPAAVRDGPPREPPGKGRGRGRGGGQGRGP